MAPAAPRPIVAPTLVGREAQLRALDELIDDLARGAGAIALISGEAGIGKSRLVAEARRRFVATTSGAILQGACFESDRSRPWAPFRDLLSSHPLAGMPDGALAARLTSTAGERDKHEVSEALARGIVALASDRPVLVVLEDLHWCDDTSLECVQLLARRIAGHPVLMLLTWRSDEPTGSLTHCLAAIDRTRSAFDLPLDRLKADDVAGMLRSIFDQPQPIRPDFLRAIVTLTDGNPFFIEEIVTTLVASGDIFRTNAGWARRELAELQIPRTVRDAVASRTRRLSADGRRVLDLAAVIGQRVDLELVQALTGLDDNRLLPLLRELVTAQLLTDVSADQLQFRHALTREAVYADLLSRERQTLHRAVTWAIEELHAGQLDGCLAELSYHCFAAEDWARAYDYARRAAERAEQLYAPRAVVEHATRAIDAATALRRAVAAELFHRRGAAHATLGTFELARLDFQQCLDLARATSDTAAEWQALLDLGGLWLGHDYQRAGGYLEAALDLALGLNDARALARSLVMLGNWHINSERPPEAEQCLLDALALFQQLGDLSGEALVIDLLAIVADVAGDVTRMHERHRQAIARYRALGDRRGLASTLATFVCAAGGSIFDAVGMPVLLTSEEAVARGTEAVEIAREIDWRAGEAYALAVLALHLAYCGQLGVAADHAAASHAIATEIGHREWTVCSCFAVAEVELQLLEPARARDWLRQGFELARGGAVLHLLYLSAGALASCCIAAGDTGAAEALLGSLGSELGFGTVGQRTVQLARAQLALARGDAPCALALVDRLLATTPVPMALEELPRVALVRGEALCALGRLADAEAALQAALDGATRRGYLPLVWRVQLALEHLYRRTSRTAAADQALDDARRVIATIAATIPDPAERCGFVERFELVAAGNSAPVQPAASPLTRREREVASLVARGLSNRDIASELYVGERTVETHVGNILGKLGFSTRAQIAVWAVESGLIRSVA